MGGVPSGVTIHSVFDSQGRRIAEYTESTGALIREYVWMGWDSVAVIEGGVVYLIRADHIGRPSFATTLAGTRVWSAVYLPFGGVHVTTGVPIDARFPGQWFQTEAGLYQNWMRDYDPTTGRYIEADPLGLVDGASVYGYAGGNPGRYFDVEGLKSILLQFGGHIFDRDWIRDGRMPGSIGKIWKQRCSDAELVYHEKTRTDRAHWHYYPYGQEAGGRNARLGRWYDRYSADHLYPPYLIDLPECPCDGTGVDSSVVAGISLLILLLLAPEGGAFAGGALCWGSRNECLENGFLLQDRGKLLLSSGAQSF
jgi:RHS repeat-associated protein